MSKITLEQCKNLTKTQFIKLKPNSYHMVSFNSWNKGDEQFTYDEVKAANPRFSDMDWFNVYTNGDKKFTEEEIIKQMRIEANDQNNI